MKIKALRKISLSLPMALFISILTLNPVSGEAANIDGELNYSIGNQGYVDFNNIFETFSKLYKLKNGTFLRFGSQRFNPQSRTTCEGNFTKLLLENITGNGNLINGNFGASAAQVLNLRDQASITSIVQDKKGFIYLSGSVSDVKQIPIADGGGCTSENFRSFLVKLNSFGMPDSKFGEPYQNADSISDGILYLDEFLGPTRDFSSISSINLLNDGVLAADIFFDENVDIIFLNSNDGGIKTSFGVNGKVLLENPSFNIHKSVQTENGIVVAGDIINNSDNSWFLRWGISQIDHRGLENKRFKGMSNYQYSLGYKEGIYVTPQYKEPYIYFVNGVLDGSTYDFKVMRMDQNGKLDSKYGGYIRNQLLSIGIDSCGYCSGEFAVDSYGRILLNIGTNVPSGPGFLKSAIVRLDQKGKIDKSFGNSGKILIDLDGASGIYSLGENKFVVYGTKFTAPNRLAQFSQMRLQESSR